MEQFRVITKKSKKKKISVSKSIISWLKCHRQMITNGFWSWSDVELKKNITMWKKPMYGFEIQGQRYFFWKNKRFSTIFTKDTKFLVKNKEIKNKLICMLSKRGIQISPSKNVFVSRSMEKSRLKTADSRVHCSFSIFHQSSCACARVWASIYNHIIESFWILDLRGVSKVILRFRNLHYWYF